MAWDIIQGLGTRQSLSHVSTTLRSGVMTQKILFPLVAPPLDVLGRWPHVQETHINALNTYICETHLCDLPIKSYSPKSQVASAAYYMSKVVCIYKWFLSIISLTEGPMGSEVASVLPISGSGNTPVLVPCLYDFPFQRYDQYHFIYACSSAPERHTNMGTRSH